MIRKITNIMGALLLHILSILGLLFIAILGFVFAGILLYLVTIYNNVEELVYHSIFCILFIAIGCTGVRYTKVEIFDLIDTWQQLTRRM